LKEGKQYTFEISDSAGDGMAGIGMLYVLSMTDNPDAILLQGDGVFADKRMELFKVPTKAEYPTAAPAPPSISPAPTVYTVPVFLTITFDNWHQETAWQIVTQEDPTKVVAEAGFDTYRTGDKSTIEIKLRPGRPYIFTIRDYFSDGIDGGGYKMTAVDGTLLFEGDGVFGAERSHQFVVPSA
jgi:hypothetical protein